MLSSSPHRRVRPAKAIVAQLCLLCFFQLLPMHLGNEASAVQRESGRGGDCFPKNGFARTKKLLWGEDARINPYLAIRLRGGRLSETRHMSNKERWESCGYSLQPDLSPEAHPDVPLETKLGDAAEFNDATNVRRLIQAGANVNCGDWAGFTPLHRAAFNGCLEAAEVLLQAGANPNIQDQVGGRTPLHQAACQGHKRVVERLIACGADPHIRDFPYKPDVNQVPGYWEALREVGPVITAEGGQNQDGTLEYRGMTPREYAEDEDQHSTAELLRPWTEEY